MQTRDGRPLRTGPEAMPGPEDTFTAYGTGWANVSNTPFRGYKHDAYEGGISTPFIAHWPNGLGDRQGTVAAHVCHLIDVMPTLLAAAGVVYPTEHAGKRLVELEGRDMRPKWLGADVTPRPPLGFEHHGNLALRDGRWKIVSTYRREQTRVWELFDMATDRTELTDLSAAQPERKQRMIAQWQRWADRVGVRTWPFPNRK